MNTKNVNIDKIVLEINNKYLNKLLNLKKNFEKISYKFNNQNIKNIMNEQRLLIKNIIIDIANYFDILKKADFIVLNGSYARCTNTLYSDIDLNIMYKDKYKDDIFPVELIINYILSSVLKFRGCDRIHTIMVYTNLINNHIPKLNCNGLFYKNHFIPYYLRENYEKLLYETYNTSRDYNVLIDYFYKLNKNNLLFNEWEYNFELVKDYGSYSLFKDKLKYNKKNYKNYKKLLIKEIEIIKKNILEYNYLNLDKQYIYIKDLKKILKTIPMKILYNALSVLSINNNLYSININCLYKSNIIDEDFNSAIYMYLWSILRVQIILNDKFNQDLSSHSNTYISSKKLYKYYYKKYRDDIIKITNNSINNIFNNIIKSLEECRMYEQ